ncbi:arsenic resistance N-acetyltransferase ArsN2 [Chitinilyticum litopenaei]|uniref:arsenic resistance N-acetyltransferase ArsN2 n=1 Tax=Chitinilyticum litopenaei TaxID=1121276 RepID=UPI000410493B|nr:arsenic resistance N-acetyltransferase ArsN2 [Chitinilyticum litopenaei]
MRLEQVADTATQDVVRQMLEDEGLVSCDLDDDGIDLLVLRDGITVVACGGLENFGECALLRSLVVRREWRGRGIAVMLLAALEDAARQRGARTAYLLTSGAERYFQRQGYASVARASVPAAIAASRQFSSLCPASAACMRKDLAPQT